MIHTVQSPQGGMFGMIMDGTLLEDIIDKFNADGEACSPIQYPPFMQPPPNFGSRNTHSVTLFYKGPSSSAPNGTVTNGAAFDAFAIPSYPPSQALL